MIIIHACVQQPAVCVSVRSAAAAATITVCPAQFFCVCFSTHALNALTRQSDQPTNQLGQLVS